MIENQLSPRELQRIREVIIEYERRQWLFGSLKKLALWISALAAAVIVVRTGWNEFLEFLKGNVLK